MVLECLQKETVFIQSYQTYFIQVIKLWKKNLKIVYSLLINDKAEQIYPNYEMHAGPWDGQYIELSDILMRVWLALIITLVFWYKLSSWIPSKLNSI